MVASAEDILNGPEYFRCERFRCTMKKSDCTERQDSQFQRQIGKGTVSIWAKHEECQGCEQGMQIRKEAVMQDVAEVAVKECKECGDPKPLGEFYENHACKDGHEGTCKECKSKQAHARYLKKNAKDPAAFDKKKKLARRPAGGKTTEKLKTKAQPVKVKAYQFSQEGVDIDPSIFGAPELLVLDTTPYPEVLGHLEDASLTHIRTVEHQALAYIVKGLQGDGYGKKEKT